MEAFAKVFFKVEINIHRRKFPPHNKNCFSTRMNKGLLKPSCCARGVLIHPRGGSSVLVQKASRNQHQEIICGVRLLSTAKPIALGLRSGAAWTQVPSQVVASSGSSFQSSSGDDIQKEAQGLRRTSWISFWLQLALSIVSAIVLFFTATTASQGNFPQLPVFFNLGGVITGFISTFIAYSRTRLARSIIEGGKKVSKSKTAADVLSSTRLNLLGLGLTLVGLQSTVGGLVGKALTSSSAGAYNVQAAQGAPAAIDVFAVQASTNTILLHFLGILFANWTLRILNKDSKSPLPA